MQFTFEDSIKMHFSMRAAKNSIGDETMEIAEQARRHPTAGAATNHAQGLAGIADGRAQTIQPSVNFDPATGGNLLIFPTGRHSEGLMSGHGDDAGRCSNGLSAEKLQATTPEERAIYRNWMFGMVAFYTTLLLLSGVVAITVDSSSNSTKFTAASTQRTAVSPRTN
jgi:hypothetical protein